MLNKYSFIDRERLGIQGQSWGGYQTAYIITQTNMFRAAMAGAPVSNMTSAYGGIRWGSGLSRAFQYEETQSRIGGTLWEKRDLYILNSPLFFADQIQTPLLMMHNDKDGAVPWYQGIEFFNALRRLHKPVWMLVYNGAPHNLKRTADMEDLTRRMQQFFDYYLKDAPEPIWMKEGIPALQKGKEFGFETD
jgi:dipeptidyl aminopeptidase/acylaminoacyl peptidase